MSAEFRAYLAALPSDHFTKANQFTAIHHNDEYDFIKPEDPRLSQRDKVIIITGASSGIGRNGLVPAFARAGAKAIYLVARNEFELQETKEEIEALNTNVKIFTKAMSITDKASAEDLFQQIKSAYCRADVLVNCAGRGQGGPLVSRDISLDGIWGDFEVNVKGSIIMSRCFAQLLEGKHKGHIINISSGAGPFFIPGTDSYGLSKLPGFERFSIQTPALAGGVALWLTTPEAESMNGRCLDATWDIPEMIERRDEIVNDGLLVMELKGDFTKGRA
ncbi:hypothetical protein BX600DRAFT_510359 [Xylariales sp. PMI_506]|nr:hypothetical protein BX600DRAFT_510359 [Xylariales sp. PMI_506]